MMNQVDIIAKVDKGVGWIKLSRPQALNALSFEMIEGLYNLLQQWKNDDYVALVCIEGEGTKAFCAGGDVRALYDLKNDNVEEYALNFFSTEYKMNMTMHNYPKPILTYMNGIVMGGGVGIGVAGSHRIVTETTKWAMPEMNIGLYPDVGGSYFLNRMPNHMGPYLALTSNPIEGIDVIYIGAADYYIGSNTWEDLRQAISNNKWSLDTAKDRLDNLLLQYHQIPAKSSSLASLEEKINKHFSFSTMEEIVHSLEAAASQGDKWAAKTAAILHTKSPTSMKVTLEQLIRGKNKSILDCFKMELELSINFMKNHDFYEGVRAVLVDKDRSPKWKPSSLTDVKREDVDLFFIYDWKEEGNPLENFI